MKHVLTVALALSGLGGALVALPGCSSVQCWFMKGACLTYEQYLSVDQSAVPAPTADFVMKTLGPPLAVHDRGGSVRRIDYHCYSITGEMKIAEFNFDENGKLVDKFLW
jgi:hypothetical protein